MTLRKCGFCQKKKEIISLPHPAVNKPPWRRAVDGTFACCCSLLARERLTA